MSPQILYRVCFGTPKADKHPVYSHLTSQMKIVPAILHEYQRLKVRHADYPGIRAQEGKTVRGTYVTGLTDACIWKLDHFEGDQYVREFVNVRLLDKDGQEMGEEVRAETYVFRLGEELEGVEWDWEGFKRARLGWWVGEEGGGEYEGRFFFSFLFVCFWEVFADGG